MGLAFSKIKFELPTGQTMPYKICIYFRDFLIMQENPEWSQTMMINTYINFYKKLHLMSRKKRLSRICLNRERFGFEK